MKQFNSIVLALGWARDKFQERGIETALLDAEVLLAHALGMERVDLYLNKNNIISDDKQKVFAGFVERRLKNEPVAYILGYKEFWSLKIFVTPDVLVPRPETEGIVELALRARNDVNLNILDLCTGSGCVAAALAKEFPDAELVLLDISPKAIEVAKRNLAFATDRATFLTGDMFEPLGDRHSCDRRPTLRQAQGTATDDRRFFNLITANPPYIPSNEIDSLPDDIKKYEPLKALDGGVDGFDISKKIIEETSDYLLPGGFLIMEIGDGQAKYLKDFAKKTGKYSNIEVVKDYADIERYLVIRI